MRDISRAYTRSYYFHDDQYYDYYYFTVYHRYDVNRCVAVLTYVYVYAHASLYTTVLSVIRKNRKRNTNSGFCLVNHRARE